MNSCKRCKIKMQALSSFGFVITVRFCSQYDNHFFSLCVVVFLKSA